MLKPSFPRTASQSLDLPAPLQLAEATKAAHLGVGTAAATAEDLVGTEGLQRLKVAVKFLSTTSVIPQLSS